MNLHNLPFRRKLRFASFVLSLLLLNSCGSIGPTFKGDASSLVEANTKKTISDKDIFTNVNVSPFLNFQPISGDVMHSADFSSTIASPKYGLLGIEYNISTKGMSIFGERPTYNLDFNRNTLRCNYGLSLYQKKINKNIGLLLSPKEKRSNSEDPWSYTAQGPSTALLSLNARLGYDEIFTRKSSTAHKDYVKKINTKNSVYHPNELKVEELNRTIKFGFGMHLFTNTHISGVIENVDFIGVNSSLLSFYVDVKYAFDSNFNLNTFEYFQYDEITDDIYFVTETANLSSEMNLKKIGVTVGLDYSFITKNETSLTYEYGLEVGTLPGHTPKSMSNMYAKFKLSLGLGKMFNLK